MANEKKKDSSKFKQILGLAKLTFQSFSAHGIPKIVNHQFGIIRAMWLIFFLASAGICAWFIQMTISNYLNYPVTTNTDIFYHKNMIFPMISICNLNPFSTDSMSRAVYNYINTLNSTENFNSFLAKMAANVFRNRVSSNTFGISNLSEVILSCGFLGSECNLSQDFESYYDLNYGNCFRFNSGKTKTLK